MSAPVRIRLARRRDRWCRWFGRFSARFAIGRDEPLSSPRSSPDTSADSPAPRADRAATSPSTDDFEQFFLAHEARVASYLWRLTGDAQTAGDLCQETFLRAWQRFATIRAYDQPEAWLLKVATNLALHHLRRRKAAVGAARPLDHEAEAAAGDLTGGEPGERVAQRDLVRETLLVLAPRARALLVLREVYGFSGEEVAGALGLSPTAAKKALFRARAEFRAVYRRKEEGQG